MKAVVGGSWLGIGVGGWVGCEYYVLNIAVKRMTFKDDRIAFIDETTNLVHRVDKARLHSD